MDSGPILTESGRNKSMRESLEKKRGERTKEMPASFFLVLAGGIVALSLGLAVSRRKRSWANFVGQWVPTILLLGIYDKIAKAQETKKLESHSVFH